MRGQAMNPGDGGRRIDVVIDTNLWLDMLVFDDRETRRLAALLASGASVTAGTPAQRAVAPIASAAMRSELADVIARDKFGLDPAQREALLARFDEIVTVAGTAPDCRLPCSDPDDRKFLDLAVCHGTQWLLSRDKALLAGRKLAWRRFELRIGKVPDFYNWLDSADIAA
jgi:predicted nucleic acid-binding protein